MKRKNSAGIAVIYDNQILLAHPTNSKWWGTYSIPKGEIEIGEDIKKTAVREFFEETGIKINKNLLTKQITLNYFTIQKTLFYFIVYINDLSELKLKQKNVPKQQLQLEEVDWCGFINKKEASKRVNKNMLDIVLLLKD